LVAHVLDEAVVPGGDIVALDHLAHADLDAGDAGDEVALLGVE